MKNILNQFYNSKEKLIAFAPMAGVSDSAYRGICASYGAQITYTEMVSALGMHYNPERCEEIRVRSDKENICAIQMFGDNPKVMADIAQKYHEPYDFIDINMGCPAPKIVKNNQGSALMRNPQLAYDIVRAMTDVLEKPVTVKIRTGWDADSINAVEFAKTLEKAGASAIAIHGRHRQQFYSGKADWNIIKQVKDELGIPVIGNGDIFRAQDAVQLIQQTNCDGVMVARGAQGNPFLFEQIKDLLNGREPKNYTVKDRAAVILIHAKELMNVFDEKMMALKMRKHLCWYSKGLEKASELKKMAIKIETLDGIESFCEKMLDY